MEFITPTSLAPTTILAIYQGDTGGHYYVERHPVKNGKVHAGMPCTRREMTKIARAILDVHQESSLSFRGAIPKNLITLSLHNGHKRLLWHVPVQQRLMHFDEKLGIPTGLAWQPDLLFYLQGGLLRVFGLRDNNTGPEAKLYLVPFHNTSDTGQVCMGTAQFDPEEQYAEDIMCAAEEAFYNSKFTHAGTLFRKLNSNINAFWEHLVTSQSTFPESGLIPFEQHPTVGSIIAQVTRNRSID